MVKRLVVICLLVLSACADSQAPADDSSATTQGDASEVSIPEPGPGSGDQVVIKTFIFRPNPLEVESGTTVTWTNQDRILHTVTSGKRSSDADGDEVITKDGMFDAEVDGAGSTFSFTFEEPGTYEYLCTIHPGMDAEITVS